MFDVENGPLTERLRGDAPPAAPEEHAQWLQKSLEAEGESVEVLNQLGYWRMEAGRFSEADRLLRRSLGLDPDQGEALLLTALNQLEWNRAAHPLARAMLERLAARDGESPAVWWGLGRAALAAGQPEVALARFDRALELDPDWAEASIGRSEALWRLGREPEAQTAAERALASAPKGHRALIQVARLAHRRGELDVAEQWYEQAAALYPWKADTRVRLGMMLLGRGDFVRGWEEYGWMAYAAPSIAHRPELDRPLWDGRPLTSERLLLFAEQGQGDAIQFARYLPWVARRAPRLTVACLGGVHRLFERLDPPIALHERYDALPEHDLWLPFAKLPQLIHNGHPPPPMEGPYLSPAPDAVSEWSHRLGGGFKVGLVWAGNPGHADDHRRSIPLATLTPLLGSGPRFFSLQMGEPAKESGTGDWGGRLTDLADEITDFQDTAAILANLDLLITVDTATAHLAGALGRPAWVMLPRVADWRWLQEGERSIWYPTLRLFRQTTAGEWGPVVARVAEALRSRIGEWN